MEPEDFKQMVQQRVAHLRTTFRSGRTRPLAWRLQQLAALKALVTEKSDEICEALWSDLHKAPLEAEVSEQGFVIAEIDHPLSHLARWMKPLRVHVPLISQPGRARIGRG